jgi:hypothetical protein
MHSIHSIRNALLEHTPKGALLETERTRAHNQNVRDSIARGENLRDAAFNNRTGVVTDRYCAIGDGPDSLEYLVHQTWYIYYQLACHTPHSKPDQDTLVLDILRIQGLGPLTRPAPFQGVDMARTTDGALWTDLPFLVPDMVQYWVEHSGALSSAQRLNFATFLAKLASARVCKDRVSQIGLHIFRYALEEARELRDPEYVDDEDAQRSIHSGLDYARLLPLACAWIQIAGQNLILLSDAYWGDCSSEMGQGGRLFAESEFGKRCPKGFSPWRWMFWLKRLQEIREEAKEAGDAELEELTTGAIDRMILKVRSRNSDILRAYKDGGEALHRERHLWCLGKEATSWDDVSFTRI